MLQLGERLKIMSGYSGDQSFMKILFVSEKNVERGNKREKGKR